MTTALTASRRAAVRAPFRVLAALICLIFIGVGVGMAYMTWKDGAQVLRVQDVVMIPGWLWFGRLMLLAAAHGKTGLPSDTRHDHWPFATARVARIYWVVLICLSVAP